MSKNINKKSDTKKPPIKSKSKEIIKSDSVKSSNSKLINSSSKTGTLYNAFFNRYYKYFSFLLYLFVIIIIVENVIIIK